MPSPYVQQAEGTGSGGSCATGTGGADFGSNVTAGNYLLTFCACTGQNVTAAVAFTHSGTATLGTPQLLNSTPNFAAWFNQMLLYLIPITGSGSLSALTGTVSGMPTIQGIAGFECAGLASSGAFVTGETDAAGNVSTAGGGTDSFSTGNVPPTGSLSAANGILFGFAYYNQNYGGAGAGSNGSAFTGLGTQFWKALSGANNVFLGTAEYQVLTATTAVPALFTPPVFVNAGSIGVVLYPSSGGGGVTETLSGQSISSSEGSAARALAYSPTGQAITSAHGTVSASVSHSLAGQTSIFTEGTITASTAANVTITLSGQTGTFTEGALGLNIGYSLTDGTPLTGQTATFAAGSPTEAIGYALTGQSIASAFGAIVPAISHGVGGQSLTLTEGAISASAAGNVTLSLSGQMSAFTQGTLSVAVGMTITGRSAAFTEGSLSRVLNATLLAQTGALTEGIISAQATGNVTRALSGQLLTLTPGAVSIFVTGVGLIMPNLVGRNLQDATAMLQAVGVLNPLTIGYFGIWPISAAWTPRKSQPSGVVMAQSVAAGTSTTVNAPITLTVTDYPMSVNYP